MIKKLVNYMYAYSHLTLHLIKSVNCTIVQLSQWTVLFSSMREKLEQKITFLLFLTNFKRLLGTPLFPFCPFAVYLLSFH